MTIQKVLNQLHKVDADLDRVIVHVSGLYLEGHLHRLTRRSVTLLTEVEDEKGYTPALKIPLRDIRYVTRLPETPDYIA